MADISRRVLLSLAAGAPLLRGQITTFQSRAAVSLCSESRIVRASGKIEWVKDPSVRNEPLDLAIGCRAVASICGLDRFSEQDWAALEGDLPTAVRQAQREDGYWGAQRSDVGGERNWFK